jgi:hypothetical protein
VILQTSALSPKNTLPLELFEPLKERLETIDSQIDPIDPERLSLFSITKILELIGSNPDLK